MPAIPARLLILIAFVFGAWSQALPAHAQTPSSRIALVIGNGAYPAGANATAPNDAGLVAQTLTAAGFDVTGARDLNGDAIRGAFRDFLVKAGQLGPDGIVFVYLAGYGVQFEGDNYYVPVDATLARDSDISLQAIRVSDLTRALSGLQLKARAIVLDAAYKTPFPAANALAGGLTLVDPEVGSLVAFNAAPGTLGPQATAAYGVYSQALSEMMREGGVPVQEVFDRVRLRVNEQTQGADVPWNASRLTQSFVFMERAPDAPAPSAPAATYSTLERRPIREFPVAEAYNAAIARDTYAGYEEFCTAFPDSPYVRRVRALLAARREALTWHKTATVGTSAAYWSYLRRYPRGLHAASAQRRLEALSVALAPPADFAPIDYDVPPPPSDELPVVDEPVVVFAAPDYGPPPPPPPVYFLPPPEVAIYDLPPPPPSPAIGFLPIPVPVPIPFARPLGQPGRIDPVQGVPGAYPQPQPFVQTNSGSLVVQPAPAAGTAPQTIPPNRPGAPPRPAPPPPAPVPTVPAGTPVGQPHQLPAPVGAPPAAGPAPQIIPPNRPGAPPRPAFLPPAPAPAAPSGQPHQLPAPLSAPPAVGPAPQIVPSNRPGSPPRPAFPSPVPAPAAPGRPNQLPAPVGAPPAVVQPRLAPGVPAPGQVRPLVPAPAARLPLPSTPGAPALPQHATPGRPAAAPAVVPPAGQPQSAIPEGRLREQQLLQQRQGAEQQRQQQLQQQRQQQDQVRQQQLQQQRQQQDQVRQQQLQQQRLQQEQVRQQQLQQQRQQQEQVRQQQMQQQRQQQDQARQQQLQQQRQQQEQVRQQQMQQQRQQQAHPPGPPPGVPHPPPGRPECGHPGQPPCR